MVMILFFFLTWGWDLSTSKNGISHSGSVFVTFYWILYRKLENENNLTKNSSSRIVCLALRIKEKTHKYFLSEEKVEKSTNIFGKEIFIRPPAWFGGELEGM